MVEPITNLKDNLPLVNLTECLEKNEQYSYIYQGNFQALDHMFVTSSLADKATFQVLHLNSWLAKEVSDHDPVVAHFAICPKKRKIDSLLGRLWNTLRNRRQIDRK